jgi:hypothetical protein
MPAATKPLVETKGQALSATEGRPGELQTEGLVYVQDEGSYVVMAGQFTVAVTPDNQAMSVTGGDSRTARFRST